MQARTSPLLLFASTQHHKMSFLIAAIHERTNGTHNITWQLVRPLRHGLAWTMARDVTRWHCDARIDIASARGDRSDFDQTPISLIDESINLLNNIFI